MALLEKQLRVKTSMIPGSGKGLFTKKFIPKGTRIVEYKGKLTTWKEVEHDNGNNGYIYYVNRNHVLDAGSMPKALARYANDARGLSRIAGLTNNAVYTEDDSKVFIESVKDIPANAEIFVSYGKEYWDTIRHNKKVDKDETRKKAKSARRSK
ncbi:MAG: SET domain-containing protein [Chitinophagaceae bacterium]|nr:MAG: SET domain-containing protein [Chitinophagaceae bacterium]